MNQGRFDWQRRNQANTPTPSRDYSYSISEFGITKQEAEARCKSRISREAGRLGRGLEVAFSHSQIRVCESMRGGQVGFLASTDVTYHDQAGLNDYLIQSGFSKETAAALVAFTRDSRPISESDQPF